MLIAIHREGDDHTTLHYPIEVSTFKDVAEGHQVFIAGGKVGTVPFAPKVKDPEPDYLDMSLEEACRVKWNRGVQEHGPTFALDPLVELYAELLDSLNYLDVAPQTIMTSVDHEMLGIMKRRIRNDALVLRSLIESLQARGRKYQPLTVGFK